MADYPPGTELPKPPPTDLSAFPGWLRPLVQRRLAKQVARRQAWLEETRTEYFSRSASQPPQLIKTMPMKLRRRDRRVWEGFTRDRHAAQMARWEAEHQDEPGTDAG